MNRVSSPYDGDEMANGLELRLLQTSSPAIPVRHEYFEIVFAPLIGPTSVLLARAMVRHVAAGGGSVSVNPVELALELGIRSTSTDPLGSRSKLVKSVQRLTRVHIVDRLADHTLGVRDSIPPIGEDALSRIPASAREAHANFLASSEWRRQVERG